MLDETSSLLSKQALADRPSNLEEMWGGNEVLIEKLYPRLTSRPLGILYSMAADLF